MTEADTKPGPGWRQAPRLAVVMAVGALLGLAALLLAPALAPELLRLDHSTGDWRTALLADKAAEPNKDIAIVLISDDTLEPYPYTSPVDRGFLAGLVRRLDEAGARVIALDIIFAKATEPAKDAELMAALKKGAGSEVKAPVVLAALDERGLTRESQQKFQAAWIAETGRTSGFINLKVMDGVVRERAAANPGSIYTVSFAEAALAAAGVPAKPVGSRIEWLKPAGGLENVFVTLPAEALVPGTEAHEKAVGSGALAALKEKIVLVGGNFPFRDQHQTPLAAFGGGETPGVVVHAQSAAQLVDGRARQRPSGMFAHLLLVGLALAGFVTAWAFGDRHGYLLSWGAATAVLVGIDAIVYGGFRVILPFTLSIAAWVLGATAGRYVRHLVHWHRHSRRAET